MARLKRWLELQDSLGRWGRGLPVERLQGSARLRARISDCVRMGAGFVSSSLKRFALLLSCLLFGCANEPNKDDYSFEMTNEIITSSIEIDDDESEYSNSCKRSGSVSYKINITPEDFSGLIIMNGKERIGKFKDPDKRSFYVHVINGEMEPEDFYFYGYSGSDSAGELEAICSMKSAKDFEYIIDNNSILMVPGVLSTFKEAD